MRLRHPVYVVLASWWGGGTWKTCLQVPPPHLLHFASAERLLLPPPHHQLPPPHDLARTTCSKVPCSKVLTPLSKFSFITLYVISIEVPRLCYMVQESPHTPSQSPAQVHFRFSKVSFIVLYSSFVQNFRDFATCGNKHSHGPTLGTNSFLKSRLYRFVYIIYKISFLQNRRDFATYPVCSQKYRRTLVRRYFCLHLTLFVWMYVVKYRRTLPHGPTPRTSSLFLKSQRYRFLLIVCTELPRLCSVLRKISWCPAAWRYTGYIFTLHIHITYSYCIFTLHIHIAYSHCIFTLHIHIAYSHCAAYIHAYMHTYLNSFAAYMHTW